MKATKKACRKVPGLENWLIRVAREHTCDPATRWEDVFDDLVAAGKLTINGLPTGRSGAFGLATEIFRKTGWNEGATSPLSYVSDGVAVVPIFKRPVISLAQGGFYYLYGSFDMPAGVLGRTVRAFKGLRGLLGSWEIYRSAIRARIGRDVPPREEPVPETLQQRLRRLPLTPEAFRYARALGVEIEGFSPFDRDVFRDRLPFWCRVSDDSSIRPAARTVSHEVRCLLNREIAEPRLAHLCKVLETLDFRVNSSCGLHLHFDQRGRTMAEVVAKARIVDKWLVQLQELLPPSRRENDFCKWGISTVNRYRAVNVTAFSRHRTLEIRCHSGTRDYSKILAWIRLCELLLVMRRRPKPASCIGTLEQLPLTEYDRAYWQARHRFLNPAQYNNPAAQNGEGESS